MVDSRNGGTNERLRGHHFVKALIENCCFRVFLSTIAKNGRKCVTLRSHRYAAESDGNGPGVANPSVAAEPEVTGPGADQNPFNTVTAGNQLPRILGNEMDEFAAQAGNLGPHNGAAVDDNQLATSAHHSVLQEGMDDSSTGQLRFFVNADGSLLDPFRAPPAAQGSGAGDENEDENESLEV